MRSQILQLSIAVGLIVAHSATAETLGAAVPKIRARELGVPFDGVSGPLDAITDVAGVRVGHTTLISDDGPLKVGIGPVRTGVTAIEPRGDSPEIPVFAGWYSLNGNGEMTGTTWVEESGLLEGPVMITNTHSVGIVRDSVIQWRLKKRESGDSAKWWANPLVAETYDGWLNDINGFHVKPEHVFQALDTAHGGAVEEGNVGGGTGMICNGFKGGIGTASRKLSSNHGGYTVGVLVQCNFGRRENLRIAGIPVGREIPTEMLGARVPSETQELGSIIVIVATDAPLMPHQLKRVARRVPLGLGRVGSTSGNGSGDIFMAFSTANSAAAQKDANPSGTAGVGADPLVNIVALANGSLDPVFDAAVEATEEAIVNAMVGAETMTGRDGHRVLALPHDQLRAILRRYQRLNR